MHEVILEGREWCPTCKQDTPQNRASKGHNCRAYCYSCKTTRELEFVNGAWSEIRSAGQATIADDEILRDWLTGRISEGLAARRLEVDRVTAREMLIAFGASHPEELQEAIEGDTAPPVAWEGIDKTGRAIVFDEVADFTEEQYQYFLAKFPIGPSAYGRSGTTFVPLTFEVPPDAPAWEPDPNPKPRPSKPGLWYVERDGEGRYFRWDGKEEVSE